MIELLRVFCLQIYGRVDMDTSILHTEKIYICNSEELLQEQQKCLEKLYAFNALPPSKMKERTAMLKEMFASLGEGCYIEPPFHANWGGRHVHFGK